MKSDFQHRYTTARHWANQQRPRIERRARSIPGRYRGNLAGEWRVFLVREVLS
ncbi:hypothetical protein [Thiothrix subterranea]|uniref:Uncharacterized protein n=1 Tax=Thiothrix subterranea TaxID=2735563 RepID=A0AA51MMK6_9GAMM|nr:hypothetical protein [Thiothrix subterranea]MDQ5769564.1 hypothetical protein [Thiothrix subterranea]WML87147.1 hypothetical protein RCG00_02040 [Thiothrix subterranea]